MIISFFFFNIDTILCSLVVSLLPNCRPLLGIPNIRKMRQISHALSAALITFVLFHVDFLLYKKKRGKEICLVKEEDEQMRENAALTQSESAINFSFFLKFPTSSAKQKEENALQLPKPFNRNLNTKKA
jgi:uncharacterized membrane protein